MFETAHDGFNLRFFSDTEVVLLAADSVDGRVLRLRLAHGFYYLARKGFDASLSEPGKLDVSVKTVLKLLWEKTKISFLSKGPKATKSVTAPAIAAAAMSNEVLLAELLKRPELHEAAIEALTKAKALPQTEAPASAPTKTPAPAVAAAAAGVKDRSRRKQSEKQMAAVLEKLSKQLEFKGMGLNVDLHDPVLGAKVRGFITRTCWLQV